MSGPRDHRSGRAAAPPPPLPPPPSLLPPSLESLPLERLPPAATPSAKAAASALERPSPAPSEEGDEYPAAAPPSFSSLFSTQESADSAAAVALALASAVAVAVDSRNTDGAAQRLDLAPPPCEHDVQEPLPAFSSLVYGPQPPAASPALASGAFASATAANDAAAGSSSASAAAGPSASSVVAETKAALERDAKSGALPRDIDDGEPPPPYSEGSSPLQSFNYVMASAGGPASIITQVSQSAGASLSALGGTMRMFFNFEGD